MKKSLPLYELHSRKLDGSPYFVHSIIVKGVKIHSQLSAYGEVEIEERIRAYLNPMAPPPAPRMVYGHAGRPSKGSKPSAGWRDDDLGESA